MFGTIGRLAKAGERYTKKALNASALGTKSIMEVNNPITTAYDAVKTGIKDTFDYNVKRQRMGRMKAMKKNLDAGKISEEAYREAMQKTHGPVSNWDRAESLFRNTEGEFTVGSVAAGAGTAGLGLYAGVNVPYRIASGGGLYRDSDGNFDLVGVPFF